MPLQDSSAHVYWESLIAKAKDPEPQNWRCLYRPRSGVSIPDWLCFQYLIYMPRARQCTHWLFTHIHVHWLIETNKPSCNGVYWLPTNFYKQTKKLETDKIVSFKSNI